MATKKPSKTKAKPVKKSPAKKVGVAKKPASKKKVAPKKVVAEIVDEHDLQSADEEANLVPIQTESEIEPDLDYDSDLPQLESKSSRSVAVTDPVALYMAEIRKYPLLSREQEQELARKYYESKDPKAAQALVTANLRFVVKVAAEYSKFGARMIDLIQEGNMGLMHAVREFNPYKGVRLITYAVWWIKGYIQEYLMKQYSLVKIGTTQNQKKLFYQLKREKEALDQLLESPKLKTISNQLGIPEDEVRMMAQRMSGRDVSLSQPLDDEGSVSRLDMQKADTEAPDEELSRKELLGHLTDAIDSLRPSLSEKEQIILEERLLNDEPLTLQEIGEKYGITREAVRQMEARLMKKIKDHYEKEVAPKD